MPRRTEKKEAIVERFSEESLATPSTFKLDTDDGTLGVAKTGSREDVFDDLASEVGTSDPVGEKVEIEVTSTGSDLTPNTKQDVTNVIGGIGGGSGLNQVGFDRQKPNGRFAPEDTRPDPEVPPDRGPDGKFVSPHREDIDSFGRKSDTGMFDLF